MSAGTAPNGSSAFWVRKTEDFSLAEAEAKRVVSWAKNCGALESSWSQNGGGLGDMCKPRGWKVVREKPWLWGGLRLVGDDEDGVRLQQTILSYRACRLGSYRHCY